jgi:hypothetical protein
VSDLKEQLDGIEGVMRLMKEHGVTKLTWDGLVLEMPHRAPPAAADAIRKAFEEHTKPLPDEPWMAVPEDRVRAWAEGGKTT